MSASLRDLVSRLIQNLTEASTLQHHWGYADRALPCTNDVGSCEYLDVVYHAHDLGMVYTGIIWATIVGILLLWSIIRHISNAETPFTHTTIILKPIPGPSLMQQIRKSISSCARHWLLPDFCKSIFGRATRLQVLILVCLTGYLTVWSFVGISYKTWVTPVKNNPAYHNTRTSLGPWSDRVGVLAFALTPLSVLLATRESLLSLITGLPYQSFNFLHRWLGYIIFVQSTFHTIGWCMIEARLYQPQPQVGREWITQLYMIWGIVAMILFTFLVALSTPSAVKRTSYEFFRKSHYLLAMLFIGACWGHWSKLSCWMIASLVVWLLDRGIRLVRTFCMHSGQENKDYFLGICPAYVKLTLFEDSVNGDVVRLEFSHSHDPWMIGQHFFLCFPMLCIWQMHPFTPLSLPLEKSGSVKHKYLFRAKKGETKKVAEMAKHSSPTPTRVLYLDEKLDVILSGPYGVAETSHLTPSTNIICIAGGTGITYVLPVLLDQMRRPSHKDRKLELIWGVRYAKDVEWVRDELKILGGAGLGNQLVIRTFITRQIKKANPNAKADPKADTTSDDNDHSVTDSSQGLSFFEYGEKSFTNSQTRGLGQAITDEKRSTIVPAVPIRPNIHELVFSFLEQMVRGPTTVYASGPGGMISDTRAVVACCNNGGKVWRGEERFDVDLRYDNRVEW